MSYIATKWIFMFFLYCFFGWCFETTVVSVSQKKFVNRGFLKGPLLPIYGSGALLIVLTTLKVEDTPVLVFFIGMLTATVLEYFTGEIMEFLFKVRYWDYSHKRFNIDGHICLSSSITWGFLSLFVVYLIHPEIEKVALYFPADILHLLTLFLLIIFVADFTTSFRTAIDLKALLAKAEAENEELARLADRIRQIEDNLQAARDNWEEQLKEKRTLWESRLKIDYLKERINENLSKDKMRLLKKYPHAKSKKYSGALDTLKEQLPQSKKKTKKDDKNGKTQA